jgi:phosphatidate phosphatase APP1
MKRNMLIAAIVLSMCLIACPARAADSFILVSDLDDTVKITNVLDHDEAIKNALASELVFAGMPELYRYLLGKNYPAGRLQFLTGSPFALKHKVRELLNIHFPAYRLTLREPKELPSKALEFKTKHMAKLYGKSGDNFLLIGDDTESDPDVYKAFAVPRPNQVLAIYIHRITGRKLPPESVAFVTAYDIAMHEFLAGRLSEKQTADVGEAVFKSEDAAFLPNFQECPPKDYEQISGLPPTLAQLKKQIEDRITTICASRTKVLKE